MSLSRSISITGSESLQVRRSGVGLVALWGLQVVVAGLFLLAGGSKLAGAAAMVALFDAIGVGQWFRYVTGFIEVMALTMVGAITTHLFIVGGSPVVPVFLLLGSLAILWARRDQLSGALSRLHRARM